ncbi:unnamed protein product, partial [Prorocentrum cordatum]
GPVRALRRSGRPLRRRLPADRRGHQDPVQHTRQRRGRLPERVDAVADAQGSGFGQGGVGGCADRVGALGAPGVPARAEDGEHLLPFLEKLGVHDLFGLELVEASDIRGAMEKDPAPHADRRGGSPRAVDPGLPRARQRPVAAPCAGFPLAALHFPVALQGRGRHRGGANASRIGTTSTSRASSSHTRHGVADLPGLGGLDLESTDDILARVRSSSNLVLLLTSGVLTRPWCLIEIATAVRHGVEVIPVEVSKPGNQFEIPNEAFYAGLAGGDLLSRQGAGLILETGFGLDEVAASVRQVFKRIVLPYSPHRPASSRKPELQKVLKACRTRKADVSAKSSLRSSSAGMAQSIASRVSYDFCPNSSTGTSIGCVDEDACPSSAGRRHAGGRPRGRLQRGV